jgi:hypothetical protein
MKNQKPQLSYTITLRCFMIAGKHQHDLGHCLPGRRVDNSISVFSLFKNDFRPSMGLFTYSYICPHESHYRKENFRW